MWKRRGNYNTIEDYLTGVSGHTLEDLLHPAEVLPSSIQNLKAAADLIYEVAQAKDAPVVIVGDYDVDGITSTAMLTMLLRHLWLPVRTIIPRRFSDGYGITLEMLKGIKDSLVITVDNGVVANDAVAAVKAAGNKVIVLDHHLPADTLPEPDVLVDPHIEPEKNGFLDYCAAGLVMKLAELMVTDGATQEAAVLMANLRVLACLGTIADVMPLVGDNRRIVKEGLAVMNGDEHKLLTAGLRAILRLRKDVLDEDTVKFTIAPIMNAPGRLYDAGSTSVLKAVLCEKETDAASYAEKMFAINTTRKDLVKKYVDVAAAELDNNVGSAIVLNMQNMPEGLCGILAGKLSRDYSKTAIVFAKSKESGVLKASARAADGFDMTGLLEELRPLALRLGGHAGAAGISIAEEQFPAFKAAVEAYVSSHWQEPDTAEYYDVELEEKDVPAALETLKKYAPYGEGIERPVFMVRSFRAIQKNGAECYRLMGDEHQHIRLTGGTVNAVGFNKAAEYMDLGAPLVMDLLADVTENVFRGTASPQLQIVAVGEPSSW